MSPDAVRAGSILGIDVGGANIKLADEHGNCVSEPFALWLHPHQLGQKLAELMVAFASVEQLAVTMTGELADCYATRREGVRSILAEIASACSSASAWIYSTSGTWLTPDQAISHPWSVAASNWHVLATWLARHCEITQKQRHMLLVDIGSTTVDLIPLIHSQVATDARTDRDRLQLGQLVYTGVERTSVAALVRELAVGRERCPVMAERFATSSDVYLVLNLVNESPDDLDTADGRSKTVANAFGRLARMIGEDSESVTQPTIVNLAQQIFDAQASLVAAAIQRNICQYFQGMDLPVLVCSGHGRPMLQRILPLLAWKLPVIWLDELLSPQIARCAPAYAAARLFIHKPPCA